MRAAVFHNAWDIRVEHVPDPQLCHPSDAIVRISHACICGSDLWSYRGQNMWRPGWRLGHEWIGIVEEVGSEVFARKRGERVLAPFVYADGSCEFCVAGLPTSCTHGSIWGKEHDGGQGEAIRVPFADNTLLPIPAAVEGDERLLKAMLLLTDVMGTGYHGAICAQVIPGGTVAIVGDGSVSLCSILAARLLGAERIFVLGHHRERLELARTFGATDVYHNDDEAIERIIEITGGGVPSVIECVGTKASMDATVKLVRPGGQIGYVGVPHGSEVLDLKGMFTKNVTLRGGLAPVQIYLAHLLPKVLDGSLDPSPMLDFAVSLDDIHTGYEAMNNREVIKAIVQL